VRQPKPQKEATNDRRAHLPRSPGGPIGASRACRCFSRDGTPRRARVRVDCRDGLWPCLTELNPSISYKNG
jgi:hypothetical protein